MAAIQNICASEFEWTMKTGAILPTLKDFRATASQKFPHVLTYTQMLVGRLSKILRPLEGRGGFGLPCLSGGGNLSSFWNRPKTRSWVSSIDNCNSSSENTSQKKLDMDTWKKPSVSNEAWFLNCPCPARQDSRAWAAGWRRSRRASRYNS